MPEKDDTIDVDPSAFNQIRHPKKRLFLRRYAKAGTIRQAAKEAQINRTTVFNWAHEDPEFVEAFEVAKELAFEVMEDEARRRATVGRRKLLFYRGEPIKVPVDPMNPKGDWVYAYERVYSDNLLMFLMKGAKPHIYKDANIPAPVEREEREGYSDLEELPPELAEQILDRLDAGK